MNKGELIDAVADDTGMQKATVTAAVESLLDVISAALKKGDRVSIIGFGNFSISHRKARTGRNPATGAEIQIAARNVPRFKAGKALESSVAE